MRTNTQETAKSESLDPRDLDSNNEASAGDALEVQWMEREVVDDARIGAMYCFKNCDRNKN